MSRFGARHDYGVIGRVVGVAVTIEGVVIKGGAEGGYKGQPARLAIPYKLAGWVEPVPNYLRETERLNSSQVLVGVAYLDGCHDDLLNGTEVRFVHPATLPPHVQHLWE